MKIHHICIQTDKYEESLKFYRDVLGFKLVEETAGFHGRYFNSWLQLGSFMIELQTNKVDEDLHQFDKISTGIVHFCLFTDDLETEYERICSTGYNRFIVKQGGHIYEVNGGKLLKMMAPEGTIVELRDSEI